MKYKIWLIVPVLLFIISCAPKLAPLDQAKVNIKLFNMQMKAINDALDEQLHANQQAIKLKYNPDWMLKKLKIEQKIDKKLKRANAILESYIDEVKLWEQTSKMSPQIIPYEHEFRAIMVGIINLLNELQMEQAKYESVNSAVKKETNER